MNGWYQAITGVEFLAARQPSRVPHHVILATTSEGLAQGPYKAARVGFEPTTFRTEGTKTTTQPP